MENLELNDEVKLWLLRISKGITFLQEENRKLEIKNNELYASIFDNQKIIIEYLTNFNKCKTVEEFKKLKLELK
jgi:hypothetical protein